MCSFLTVLVLFTLSVTTADAGPVRNRRAAQPAYARTTRTTTVSTPAATASVSTTTETGADALAQVNAQRAARGLRPFLRDEGLSQAANRCAAFRARHGLFGHTGNDFSFVVGGGASAAGCAAYPASYGFMACCTYENYTYAGAASVVGADGRSYHHIFVR